MGEQTPQNIEALEAQARTLLAVFMNAGFEAVAPAVIQPAGVFLNVLGESLRARTYVFNDLNGAELCLRPDLTVPACRLYLERDPAAQTNARYCYNGVAFRFQRLGADAAHPREFRQAGIERFGEEARAEAEAEALTLVLTALQQTGLQSWKLRIGDLGLFDAILDAVEMPQRWRAHLRQTFWRPEAFHAELKRLATNPARADASVPVALLDVIDPDEPGAAEGRVAEYLDQQGIELIGVRTLSEIAEGLVAIAADAKAAPLSEASANLIERYTAVTAPVREASATLRAMFADAGPGVAETLDAFDERLALLEESGVDLSNAEFCAEFGRNLAYYTGFVFEVVVPELGPASPVAGGGRYDSLLKAVGAPRDLPAVGAAIHTERLLSIVRGGRS